MMEERAFDPSVLEAHSPGHWQILEHALSGRLSADNLFIIQWPRFAPAIEDRGVDLQALSNAVLDTVKSQTPCEALCLPFEESSMLVVIGESATDFLNRCAGSLSDDLCRSFPGSTGCDADLRPAYWVAADPDQISLRFRRHGNGRTAANGSDTRSSGRGQGPASSRLVLPDADYFYFPLWNVSENRLFAYLCRPFWEVPSLGRLTESSPDVAAISPDRLAAIDQTIFESASAFIQNALDNYGTAEVIVPVHASLFESETALNRFFETVDRAIWAIAELVWFEVISRADEPNSLVASAIERLSSYGRAPMIRINAGQGVPDAVVSGEVWSVGFEIDTAMPAEEKCTQLESFRDLTSGCGCPCHVIGLKTPDETLEAVNSGFDFIGSEALLPPLAAPDNLGVETQPTDLLRTILASRS